MARYTDSVCKLCRREGMKLFLKGERCLSPKCAVERRAYPPGMHGKKADLPAQDVRLRHAVAREAEGAPHLWRDGTTVPPLFRRSQPQHGMTGVNLLAMLERRLDNVVYRLGLADSRPQARQLVRHGHFEVNGRKTNIPSFQVSVGDVIKVRESSQSKTYFKDRAQLMQGAAKTPAWLKFTFTAMSAEVVGKPAREDVEIPLNEQLIVEYYSR